MTARYYPDDGRHQVVAYCEECSELRPLHAVRFAWELEARGVCDGCLAELEALVCASLAAWLEAARADINRRAFSRAQRGHLAVLPRRDRPVVPEGESDTS